MSQYHLRWGGLASLFYLFSIAILPVSAESDILLTQAEVRSFRNRVQILLNGGLTRSLRDRDRLGFGDTLLTQQASQVDLQFNDGSQVRLGELATFWFVPNSRDFRLGHGTTLLRIPPGRSLSTLETPNAIAEMQGAAVVVRYIRPAPPDEEAREETADPRAAFQNVGGRTAVMVLAADGDRPVQVSVRNGRSVDLIEGQMAIVDNDNLYIFEFDLALFYDTSSLLRGLPLTANPDHEDAVENSAATPMMAQPDFVGDYWLDPQFLAPDGSATTEGGWLFPATTPATNRATEETPPPDADGATEATHDASAIDIELSPPATDPSAPEPQMTSPSQDTSDESDVPAGVIPPPTDDSIPESM